jgi:hypothetical protein
MTDPVVFDREIVHGVGIAVGRNRI